MDDRGPSDNVLRAWARLVKASHVVLAAVEGDLKAAGFPPPGWYDLLLDLCRGPGEGLRPFEIEAETLLPQHDVSRLVARLEKPGYVERRACAEDGRGHRVVITAAGRDLVRRMGPTYRAAIEEHVGRRLGRDGKAETLARLLGRLVKRRGKGQRLRGERAAPHGSSTESQ